MSSEINVYLNLMHLIYFMTGCLIIIMNNNLKHFNVSFFKIKYIRDRSSK